MIAGMTQIIDLPERTVIQDADSLIFWYAGAASNPTRRITWADLIADLVKNDGDADLNEVEINDLTAEDATIINLEVVTRLRIGGGTNINQVLRGSGSVAVSSIDGGNGATYTITVPGAATGDHVIANMTAVLPDGLHMQAWVSAADTVSLRFFNSTGGSISGDTYGARVLVVKASNPS